MKDMLAHVVQHQKNPNYNNCMTGKIGQGGMKLPPSDFEEIEQQLEKAEEMSGDVVTYHLTQSEMGNYLRRSS